MSTPIYIAIAILIVILLVILFSLKKLNSKISDIALKTDFFDQKLDSSNEKLLSTMNQQYTDIITSIKNMGKEICKYKEQSLELSDNEIYEDVKKYVIETDKASASHIQRRFKIGYSQSARLLERLENEGFIGSVGWSDHKEILKEEE